MSPPRIETLGPPDIKIFGFQFWVHGREFPDAQDYCDGNWLRMTAYCDEEAWVSGSYVTAGEMQGWLNTCINLLEKNEGTAGLKCLEPELDIHMTAKPEERVEMIVTIKHQPYDREHKCKYHLKTSDLTKMIQDLKLITEKYPILGAEEEG